MTTPPLAPSSASRRGIVPPYLLARIADRAPERFAAARHAARQTLAHDPVLRTRRTAMELTVDGEGALVAQVRDAPDRVISDAQRLEVLPGVTVRTEDTGPVDDTAVNDAFDGLGATFDLLLDAFERVSIDGRGATLRATVHYGRDYDNAFWDGERMVFGDGDGEVFTGFTGSVSVIGHELAHGVIQHTANLVYRDQPGALNESIADVLGALTEQHLRGQSAADASWLIGAGIFTPEVEGVALRSMRAPGTAYDDDILGRDPQPAHVRDFVVTDDDNGGVHINSGIPNRAFVVTALALDEPAWQRAGLVWYRALTGGLAATADFETFARATLSVAIAEYGESSEVAEAVRAGWVDVGLWDGRDLA
jgi:Zn-dependent metalloprotease